MNTWQKYRELTPNLFFHSLGITLSVSTAEYFPWVLILHKILTFAYLLLVSTCFQLQNYPCMFYMYTLIINWTCNLIWSVKHFKSPFLEKLSIFSVGFRRVMGIWESVNQVKWQKTLKVMETATEGKMIFLQHNNLNKLNTLSARQCAIFGS